MTILSKLGYLCALPLVCAACSTSYGPESSVGGIPVSGYSESHLDSNTVTVNYHGNRAMSPGTIRTFLLYRCAEVTVDDGYDYFVIISTSMSPLNTQVKAQVRYHQLNTPRMYDAGYTTENVVATRPAISNTETAYPYSSAATYQAELTNAVAVIKMFKGTAPPGGTSYNAKDVMAHLGPATLD